MLIVWISSLIKTPELQKLIAQYAPDFIQNMFYVPLDFVASPAGRIAAGYDDPPIIILTLFWAISRGARAISGSIDDGTLEMVLAHPVPRAAILLADVLVTLFGCVLIGMSAWLGTTLGVTVFTLEEPISVLPYLGAAANGIALGIFITGVTMLISSWDASRSRTVSLAIGFCAVEAVLQIVAAQAPQYPWIAKATFFSCYVPQRHVYNLLNDSTELLEGLFNSCGVLIAVGMLCFVGTTVIFMRRDLPAPL